jgi:signal transduction histidine kinase
MPVDFKYRFFYLFIGLTFYTLTGNAQADKDSLLNVVQNSQDINARISAKFSLTYYMMWTDIDSSKKMLDDLSSIVAKDGNTESKAKIIGLKGTFYWFSGNYDSALFYYRKCIVFAQANNLKKQYKGTISNLGALFNQLSIPDSSLHYLNIALQIAREEKDTATMSKVYFDLGILYNKMNYSSLALENLLKAKTFYLKTQDTLFLSLIYNSLGITYQKAGNFENSRNATLTALKYDLVSTRIDKQMDLLNNLGVNYWKNSDKLDSAKFYIMKAIEMPSSKNKPVSQMVYYLNLGGIEFQLKNYDQALAYFRKAQAIELPYDDPYNKSALFVNLGAAWLSLKNTDSAYFYSMKGLEIANKIDAFDQIQNGYNTLFLTDSTCKNYLSAIHHYQLHSAISDTISNVEVRNKIAELQIVYQTAQKEKENLLLTTQNQLSQKVITNQKIIVFISLAALLSIFVFLILLLRNQRKLRLALTELTRKNTEIEIKQEEIKLKNEHLQIQKQELTELNQTKDKFFSVIAHDLKSPFNALLGFLDILENEFDQMNDSEKFEIIKILHQSSQNTYNLLINLLDWSRSQRGLIKNQPEVVQLHEIAKTAIGFLNQRSRKKEHIIQNLISTEHFVFADPNLTQTVFINLINNAIKFTPRNGIITITSREANKLIEIAVSDNGIGIPNDKIGKLFSIDSDFNRRGTENEIGTGLGLKMFKDFVEIMGGTISVVSEENKGTTFSFSLPVYHSGDAED